ncbi:MAG: rane protein [Rhizobium sp.]|nr:rane protein [Rhizobium sp.]
MPIGRFLKSAKTWAKTIKRDVVALWIAARDPRTPVVAKIAAAAVAAYALSPIDLIPDFIPVLGYLDDLVIVPLGIMLAVRLVPQPLMTEFRDLASRQQAKPRSRAGLVAIIFLWATAAVCVAWYAYRAFVPL